MKKIFITSICFLILQSSHAAIAITCPSQTLALHKSIVSATRCPYVKNGWDFKSPSYMDEDHHEWTSEFSLILDSAISESEALTLAQKELNDMHLIFNKQYTSGLYYFCEYTTSNNAKEFVAYTRMSD